MTTCALKSETFLSLSETFLKRIVSVGEQMRSNVNVLMSRQVKYENRSLPVTVRGSKTSRGSSDQFQRFQGTLLLAGLTLQHLIT